jgi:acetyl-CoA synthetase
MLQAEKKVPLGYTTYEDAKANFRWAERWDVFDNPPERLNIAYECVDRHPRKNVAIRLKFSDGSKETFTYGELSDLSSRFANLLERLGIGAGDRVAIALHPSIELYVAFFGILKRGAVAVPCYPLLGPEGFRYRLDDSGSKLILIDKKSADNLPENGSWRVIRSDELGNILATEPTTYTTNTSADTLAVVQYSSGTTGLPKQVLYNHSTIGVAAVYTKFWLGLRDGDRYLCTSSTAWGHGIWYGIVGPSIFGNGIGAFSGKFDPEVLIQGLKEFEITVMSAIPRVYVMLMNTGKFNPEEGLKLRRMTYTGAAIEKNCQEYLLKTFGFIASSTYGNTEVGPIAIDYAFDDYRPKIGAAGRATLGTKVAALNDLAEVLPPGEVGELSVFRKDEWRSVGDTGFVDAEGYITSHGRSDDVIKSSGFRIGPFEVETVLNMHPAVQDCAVIGSPDPERGETVKAFIVPNCDPIDALTKEIQEFVKAKLSMHEYPRKIEYVEELPRTPDGKLKRKVLKEMEMARIHNTSHG